MMGLPAAISTVFEIFVFFKQQRQKDRKRETLHTYHPYHQITYINWGLGFLIENITLHFISMHVHDGIKHISRSSADTNH
jgi:hypothetical protein